VAPFESGRRLCLLVEAGETRYALEATSVMEVALPGSDGTSLRGMLEVKDLSVLLGGAPEKGQGMVVVLDVSPTLAPFFLLPAGLGEALVPLSRGAVLHKERLYLELIAESLPQRGVQRSPLALRPAHLMESPPERALVFESQGRLFGLPLGLVSQVVTRGEAFSRLPVQRGAVAGVFPHAQVLWPIFSVPAMLGGSAEVEAFFVLTEMAGQNVGLCATRVLGVLPRFEPTEEKGEFRANGLPGPVLFLDLQHMFS